MTRSVDAFLSSQFRAWHEKEREKSVAPPLPLITVSREFGAYGARLAQALGERLGWSVWDQKLLTAIADKTGAEERFLASLDERRRGTIADLIDGAILGNAYMRSEFLQALMSVVHTVASHGSAIIVGRGANYIVPPEDCLRVRVVCPFEQRVAGVVERHGGSEKEARSRITKHDKQRQTYLRQHFKRDGTNASDYDVVLNAGSFDLNQLCELVVAMYKIKFERDPESG